VIVEFDGQTIDGREKLRWLASVAGVGRSVVVRVIRESRTLDLRLTLGELPELERSITGPGGTPFR
jgi:serine protease Do